MIAPDLLPLVRPLASLREDPRNARKHDPRNLEAIQRSLQEFGQRKPVVALVDGTVIAGNGTLAAARALGWAELAVATFEDEARARAFAIADNRTSDLSVFDDAILLEALEGMDEKLREACGFTGSDLVDLAGPRPGRCDPDDVPEPPEKATTAPGDLWILGDHRLLCGDSGKAEDIARLLEGGPVHLLNTDPPYNVRVEPRSNNAIAAGLSSFQGTMHHQAADLDRHPEKANPTHRQLRAKDRPLENDFVSDEAFRELLRAWFGNAARVLLPGRGFYIWGGYSNIGNYPGALEEAGLYFSQAIIWVKEHPVLTRKDFMGNHEWCFYGWREGAAHYFDPTVNNETDVWSVKKVSPQKMVHLTEKPVELAARAMRLSSRPGETVLDLFGGSGSTLVAAEQLGRRARLVEIDPLYCDVIVQRFEAFTGKKAERSRSAAA